MRINRLEAHDRLLSLKKEKDQIQQGAEDCKYKNPLSQALLTQADYIYIFAHKREIGSDEKIAILQQDIRECLLNPSLPRRYKSIEEVPHFRILWQPRLVKPEPQENSMLFRTKKDSNDFEVFWVLPPAELWGQHKKGNLTEEDIVIKSIAMFKNNKEELRKPHPEDLPLERVRSIYLSLKGAKQEDFDPIKLDF